MNISALVGGQRARAADKAKIFKADSIGFCILKAIEGLSPDAEPWKVRLTAEQFRGKVITDGAFFGTINRLKMDDCLEMVKRTRRITVGETSREESVGVYQLSERGRRSLLASQERLNEAQQRELDGKLSGAFQMGYSNHQP